MELPINPFLNVHEKYSNMKIINPYRFAGGGGTSNGLLNNLISCYELDETSGSTAYDSHGSNDGTINGATINQTGKIGKAFDFDGTDDYIDCNGVVYNIDNDVVSLSGWMYFDDVASEAYLAGSRNGNSGWGLAFRGQDSPSKWRFVLFGVVSINFDSWSPNIEQWYHIVLTWDGSTAKLYIDGTSYDTKMLFYSMIPSTNNMWLAALNNTGVTAGELNGKLDQPAIWNAALTATQVEALYNSGNGLAYSNWTT